MYLAGTLGAPLKMRLLTVLGNDGEEAIRLAAPEMQTHTVAPAASVTVLDVKNAALLGRVASFAIYSVGDGAAFVAVNCNDFFGAPLQLTSTLSEALQACRRQATSGLPAANTTSFKVQA